MFCDPGFELKYECKIIIYIYRIIFYENIYYKYDRKYLIEIIFQLIVTVLIKIKNSRQWNVHIILYVLCLEILVHVKSIENISIVII